MSHMELAVGHTLQSRSVLISNLFRVDFTIVGGQLPRLWEESTNESSLPMGWWKGNSKKLFKASYEQWATVVVYHSACNKPAEQYRRHHLSIALKTGFIV